MKVDKLSISFDPELGDAVRSAAAQAGKPVSSWLAEAATSKLRAEALAEFLAGWEAEHRVLTAAEIARAERELGLASVALLAAPGDRILTSDPRDLSRLAEVAGNQPVIITC